MQIYLLFAERKSDALQLKILIYRPKGTVCKGFRRKDRRFSYLQGEICGGRVLRASAGEGSARTAPWRRSVAAGVAGFDRPAGRSGRIAKIADEVTASARAPGAGAQNSGVCCALRATMIIHSIDRRAAVRSRPVRRAAPRLCGSESIFRRPRADR